MPSVPTVFVKLMPVELPVKDIQGGAFQVDQVVTLTKHAWPTLLGKVESLAARSTGVAMKLAITSGDLSNFTSANSTAFRNYTVTSATGVTGMVAESCITKHPHRPLSRTALQLMVSRACGLIDTAARLQKTDHAVRWFGKLAFEPAHLLEIQRRCKVLNEFVSSINELHFLCLVSETLGSIDNLDPWRGGPRCRIRLGRGFTYTRYSWGERVCTIVHELTHWCLNTVDALNGNAECYGVECLNLAKNPDKLIRQRALNNADNWAYYICQYRETVAGEDWRFFTEEELRARGPFAPNGYGLEATLMA